MKNYGHKKENKRIDDQLKLINQIGLSGKKVKYTRWSGKFFYFFGL